MYALSKLKIYIHIPNINESIRILHEGKWLKGIHVYLLALDKIIYTWSKTCTKIGKTSVNERIIKLDYTCTCNEYKWAMKYKHIIIKCSSLLVQV